MHALIEVIVRPVDDNDRTGIGLPDRHKATDGGWRGTFKDGLDPQRADYRQLCRFLRSGWKSVGRPGKRS